MIIGLTILGMIIFIAGCYFCGNAILDTFHDDIIEQIMSSIYGIIFWVLLAFLFMIGFGIYIGIRYMLANIL